MIYYTSDLHWGHENIITMCDRPFHNLEDMNERLIDNWNQVVHGNDTVYIVGDMFFRCNEAETILRRLKGKKKLIVGNHDTWVKHVDCTKYFTRVEPFAEANDGKHAITLCHYPLLTWKHSRRTERAYMIHGHIHNDCSSDFWPLIQIRDNVLNAGVDINSYRPVCFDELLENNRSFKSIHE